MQYAVVIEQGPDAFGAYVPDLPGCVAVGASRDEVLSQIREAIGLHIEMLSRDGACVPVPASTVTVVEVTQ